MQRKTRPVLWLVAAFAIFAGALWQQRAEQASPQKWARVQSVVAADERAPLLKTLALIDAGGPFPYPKDGATFSNRENRLPQQPRGYYREYTVPTPDARNRGARRVVQGRNGDTWYTHDHYESFVRIDE